MKLEKLLTLSQFVDHVDKQVTVKSIYDSEACDLMFDYNNFIKQPPIKELFINIYIHPDNLPELIKGTSNYNIQLDCWQEFEKKVIFKGWRESTYSKFFIISGVHEINFSNANFIVYHRCDEDKYCSIKTLHDLSIATNGELTLKNVTV